MNRPIVFYLSQMSLEIPFFLFFFLFYGEKIRGERKDRIFPFRIKLRTGLQRIEYKLFITFDFQFKVCEIDYQTLNRGQILARRR